MRSFIFQLRFVNLSRIFIVDIQLDNKHVGNDTKTRTMKYENDLLFVKKKNRQEKIEKVGVDKQKREMIY